MATVDKAIQLVRLNEKIGEMGIYEHPFTQAKPNMYPAGLE